jgi:tocopherol cyclase
VVASFSLLDRLKDPAIFQGNLGKKRYFEGWYFKQSNLEGNVVLSIIPGVSLAEEDRHLSSSYSTGRLVLRTMRDLKLRNSILFLSHSKLV